MQNAPNSLDIRVFDAAGKLLRSLHLQPNGGQYVTNIDLQDLPNGAYVLQMTDGKQWGGVRVSKVK
jgi:hypothetical protein